jgi:hypothetical protein
LAHQKEGESRVIFWFTSEAKNGYRNGYPFLPVTMEKREFTKWANTEVFNYQAGAEEGTRTPTPLRVHGPEPCASANSATSALMGARQTPALRREYLIYFRGFLGCVKPGSDG